MNGRDLARSIGISEKQIYYWARKKWLTSSRVPAGHWDGFELWFPEEEQVVARRMAGLVRAGMYPDAAVKVARGHKGALSKILSAVQPCLTEGEMTYRLVVGTVGSEPAAASVAPDSVGPEPCG